MRRKTTRDILAESFRELAATTNIDKITIRDIAENCGYSPATFYRHFKDKYDLIAWKYTRDLAEIMDRTAEDGYSWKQTLSDGALFFQNQKEYLANLFLHTSGYDSFMLNMTEINFNALKKYILKTSGRKMLYRKTEMYIRIYCLGTVSLTCEWILGKHPIPPQELAEVFENALPAPLHQFFYQKK